MSTGGGDAAARDGGLLADLSSRDPSAFMRVYDSCGAATYALALRMVGRVETAEAVIEEVFLALWRNPDAALSEPRGLQGYLAESVRQRARGYLEDA